MKIDPNFQYDVYSFLHRPIRELDKKVGRNFLERFLMGVQFEFESQQARVNKLSTLYDPATIRADLLQYLKDQVGFTRDLNNITNGLSENDLRKLISLAVALWKQKGIEPGYENIVRLFTGKTARIFNWFDFRYIVGEAAFGEEQLGEDAWFISVPGVEGSEDISNNVVALFTFEGNAKDRSLTRNHGLIHADVEFYTTPVTGFPLNSTKYAAFVGGVVEVDNSDNYDLSGNFTVEFFYRSEVTETNKTIVYKRDISGKGFSIEINKATNEIKYTVSDGTNTVTDTLTAVADIDDGLNRHIALVVNRTLGARLYLDGDEATAIQSMAAVGDVTNFAKMFIGGEGVGINVIKGDVDNFRLSLNAVYIVSNPTFTTPLSGFIEFQEELLDEFYTDVRIVDEGNLNKTLIMRILNLMRPVSERLNVIFTRFYADFVDGIGQFNVDAGAVQVNIDGQMELSPSSQVSTSVLGDVDFQDIVLQVKANDKTVGGGIFGIMFFYQDTDNYYEYRINTVNHTTSLWKKVAGVFTQISVDKVEDIVPNASYVFTIVTDKSESSPNTIIKAYVDSNKQHEVFDSSFEKGKFGMKTDASTIMQVNEIEMIEIPMDVQTVGPNFEL